MLKKNWILVIAMVLALLDASAQNVPHFTQSFNHNHGLNPAFAGAGGYLEAAILHRSSYAGLTTKPSMSTQLLRFSMPIQQLNSGLGLAVQNDMIGLLRSTQVSIQYNYRISLRKLELAFGVQAGIIQSAINGNQITTPGGSYLGGNINHNDVLLPNNRQSSLSPDIGVGVYAGSKDFYLGLGLSNLYGSGYQVLNKKQVDFSRSLRFQAGYNRLIKNKLSIEPSIFLQSDFQKVLFQFNLMTNYSKYFITGVSARGFSSATLDAVSFIQGFSWKGFSLVYSYDIGLSYLRNFNSGAHEIGLTYKMQVKSQGRRGNFYHNPRFL